MNLNQLIKIVRNMGLKYLMFRGWFIILKKSGLISFKYPQKPKRKDFISLSTWREHSFFWGITRDVPYTFSEPIDLTDLKNGFFTFFSAERFNLGNEYDWVTNPTNQYKYNVNLPWWRIEDYSYKSGDIKYVWEKSRFSFLYDILRHDQSAGDDNSEFVFNQIESWIDNNPINAGPNHKCSQEISLRLLNWTYALYYYKESKYLTDLLFSKIIHSIYWQIKHVFSNINFSRIAVRNNHAITETLALYILGHVYSFFPESKKWVKQGKMWFEKEIEYQIYPDGTYLQFSMNYHRVVIQLLSWAFKTADFYGDKFSQVVYNRAYASLKFLSSCQDGINGWLPNYGSNDGALFFKFTDCDFRDYRPQLNTLHILLTGNSLYGNGPWDEDSYWLKAQETGNYIYPPVKISDGWANFEHGGYFVLREGVTLTFIRCGKHKDRPAQADNLHIDIWHNGENILFDGGSYKYNTDKNTLKYFMGTKSHNTVMLGDYDQMLKGPRFIWYNWSQAISADTSSFTDKHTFTGEIYAFNYLGKKIRHLREVWKIKDNLEWVIIDVIINKPQKINLIQHWNLMDKATLTSTKSTNIRNEEGWRSDYYGIKIPSKHISIETSESEIVTKLII